MDKTKIQWTDATWNPVTGCTKVSAGCKNCYAEALAARFWVDRKFTSVFTHKDRLDQPLRWRRPRRVFVNSMSDLFHDAVPDEFIEAVFGVMAVATHHTFQVLTKRPERMLRWLRTLGGLETREECVQREAERRGGVIFDSRGSNPEGYFPARPTKEQLAVRRPWPGWPLPNVWLGVSVEDQRAADERIPLLLQTPAAVRFLSCEPLLGSVQLGVGGEFFDYGVGGEPRIGWVITGGESGPGARPCDVAWIRSIVQQCKAAGVPTFVKQLGAVVSWNGIQGGYGDGPSNCWPRESGSFQVQGMPGGFRKHLCDRKGGDPSEWPEDLRVREFPAVEARS